MDRIADEVQRAQLRDAEDELKILRAEKHLLLEDLRRVSRHCSAREIHLAIAIVVALFFMFAFLKAEREVTQLKGVIVDFAHVVLEQCGETPRS